MVAKYLLKMKFQIVFFIVSVKLVTFVSSSRILAAIPSPFYSHQAFYRPLWQELAARGHQLVLLTPYPMNKNITNINEIDLSFILDFKPNLLISTNFVKQVEVFNEAAVAYSNQQLAHADVQKLINNASEHFDLLIVEVFVLPYLAFKERFKCPMIIVSSMDLLDVFHDAMGNPTHDLLYSYVKVIKNETTFWDRVWTFLHMLEEDYLMKDYNQAYNDIVRRHFGKGYMLVQDLVKEVDMCFINSNIAAFPPRPLTPAVVNIGGGMHLGHNAKTKPNNLPQDLQTFLDESKHGVIFFNMGTSFNASNLPPKAINEVLATFASIKYDVLWKFENESLLHISTNVKLTKWLPQFDVLRHKNVKLFMTQGGLHSVEEALIGRKPMIVFPFLADQHSNAIRIEELGLGLHFNLLTITSEQLTASICNVIENPEFNKNVEKFSKIMQDKPMGPLDSAVWWIEYVLRHNGAKHLRGKSLPTWSFYYLDVVAFLFFILSTLCFVFILFTKRILFYLTQNKESMKEKVA